MRLDFVVLVAAASLLATGSATIESDQNKVSTMGTADVIQLMDAEVAAIAKRSLRTSDYDENEEEEEEDDSDDDDTTEEERGINVGALDNVVGKAAQTKVADDVLKKLVSTDALKNALKDPKQTLFKNLYEGNVSPKKFAQFIRYDLSSNMGHQFENVYTSFNWYSLYRKSLAANTVA